MRWASVWTSLDTLSETQLDGARFPFILVLGHIVTATPPQVTMALELHVREAVHTVPVSVRFERLPGSVLASGHLGQLAVENDKERTFLACTASNLSAQPSRIF